MVPNVDVHVWVFHQYDVRALELPLSSHLVAVVVIIGVTPSEHQIVFNAYATQKLTPWIRKLCPPGHQLSIALATDWNQHFSTHLCMVTFHGTITWKVTPRLYQSMSAIVLQ